MSSPTGRRSSRCAISEQSRRCIVLPSPAVTDSPEMSRLSLVAAAAAHFAAIYLLLG